MVVMKTPALRYRLTIGKKILLGYFPVLILLLAISIFTLLRLNLVNRLNREIIAVDLVVNREAENMIDILLTQESYSQRYMILKSQDMLSLFWKRDQEFNAASQIVNNLSGKNLPAAMDSINALHREYISYFQTGITRIDSTDSHSYLLADSLRREVFTIQIGMLKQLVRDAKKSQTGKTWQTAQLGRSTFQTVSIMSFLGVALAIGLALIIIRGIIRSINTLRGATELISKGLFKNLPTITDNDELGELSNAFNVMAARLVELEELYVDSSPLTRLPGGIAIENAVKKRIESKEHFAFCMFDLDNFKPFNDRYGYSRGNAVIKATAAIIQKCSQELGDKTDFVGHIGGDDFALLAMPGAYEIICNRVIADFDKQILDFYNPEDRDAGHILSVSRMGKKLTFPIMTISIAAINTEKSFVENYIEVGEIIAELKKFAKSMQKSNLAVDRRGGKIKKTIAIP